MNIVKKEYLSHAINILEKKDLMALRVSTIAIFFCFGIAKWFEFEIHTLKPLITSTWLNIFNYFLGIHGTSYLLGVIQLLIVVLLVVGFRYPVFGAAGCIMVILSGLATLSLLLQIETPALFMFKNMIIVSAGLTLLKRDLISWKEKFTHNETNIR
jgi:uncharacterized membrane protein YkgB